MKNLLVEKILKGCSSNDTAEWPILLNVYLVKFTECVIDLLSVLLIYWACNWLILLSVHLSDLSAKTRVHHQSRIKYV